MMKAINAIRVKKGRADEVLVRFSSPKAVHTFEGFVFMEVLKKENSPDYDELHICTTWEERKHFDNWLESRYNQRAHSKKSDKEAEENPILGNELSTFEVVYQHEPATTEVSK